MFDMAITVDPIIQHVPNADTSFYATKGVHYSIIPSPVEYSTDWCEKYDQ